MMFAVGCGMEILPKDPLENGTLVSSSAPLVFQIRSTYSSLEGPPAIQVDSLTVQAEGKEAEQAVVAGQPQPPYRYLEDPVCAQSSGIDRSTQLCTYQLVRDEGFVVGATTVSIKASSSDGKNADLTYAFTVAGEVAAFEVIPVEPLEAATMQNRLAPFVFEVRRTGVAQDAAALILTKVTFTNPKQLMEELPIIENSAIANERYAFATAPTCVVAKEGVQTCRYEISRTEGHVLGETTATVDVRAEDGSTVSRSYAFTVEDPRAVDLSMQLLDVTVFGGDYVPNREIAYRVTLNNPGAAAHWTGLQFKLPDSFRFAGSSPRDASHSFCNEIPAFPGLIDCPLISIRPGQSETFDVYFVPKSAGQFEIQFEAFFEPIQGLVRPPDPDRRNNSFVVPINICDGGGACGV